MTTINPVSNQPNVNFKGIAQNENGISYHKSNTGLITGSVLGGLGVLTHLSKGNTSGFVKKMIETSGEEMTDEIMKNLEAQKKAAIPFAIIAGLMSIGCGVLIDKIRNQKAAESANVIANSQNIHEAFMQDENIQTNQLGLPYHHSKTGTKMGALTGAACGLVHGGMGMANMKGLGTLGVAIGLLSNAALFALGGWGLGAMYDKIVNGKAKDAATHIYSRSFNA